MNGRWAARILGLILILVVMLLFLNLQRQLVMLSKQRGVKPATTTVTK